MRWVYYAVALLATVLAGLLWLFVFGQFRPAGSVPAPVAASLPVVPVLRPAPPATVGGERERFFCVAGYVARQTGNSVETLLVGNKPVRCP